MAKGKNLIKQASSNPNLDRNHPNQPNHEQYQGVTSEHKPNAGQWVAGRSGNPAGRPQGSRQKISERLLSDLADVWEKHGRSVLARLAVDEPGKLASIAYGLLPKDIFISVEQKTPAGLDPDDWARMVSLARTMKEIAPDASLDDIEHALRSAFAKTIE
jgi:hypothetical protein